MNRLLTVILMTGLTGLLAGCGSSVKSSTQPAVRDEYSVVVSPNQFTVNAGDWSTITAVVQISNQNSAPRSLTPQPTIKFFSSDPRVTISPGGEVCGGQWDTKFLTCTPTVFPQSSPNAGKLDLPTGQVTITALDDSHSVSGTTLVTVHPRPTSIALTSPAWLAKKDALGQTVKCIAQNDQVQYIATPTFENGATGGTVLANDYTWESADPNVAVVSSYGFVAARNPGVTTIYAKLGGTISVPLAFATCPPSGIVLKSSAFRNGVPIAPFSTDDLLLNLGDQKFLTATLLDANGAVLPPVDVNGKSLVTLTLNYVSSDPLTGSFSTVLPLTAKLGANTSGRFSVMAACEPPTCNNSVPDFVSPAGATHGIDAGFGYPIYSNAIGVTVQGMTGSSVLVTNSADVANPLHRLLVYDSESMVVTQRIELANLPNSLVVAPNGAKAYLGSDAGLVVVDLSSFQSSLQTFPIIGGLSTDFITGKVLGVSPDSRYVVVSDKANGLVFFIDTTGTKAATRYTIPGINAVTFAPDNSNMWIAGTNGVYVFNSDTFVKTLTNSSTAVEALAWVPDGQSYVASGSQLVDYSTCDDRNPQLVPSPGGTPMNLSTTVIGGVPHLIGLSGTNQWLNYSVSTSAQVSVAAPKGNVCLSTVTVNAPSTTASGLTCNTPQVSFSQRLQQAFVTGYPSANGGSSCSTPEAVIHGYDVAGNSTFTLSTLNNSPITPLSGGVLSDGRKLYVGSYDPNTGAATLHRFDIASGTEDFATNTTTTGTPPTTVTTVTIPASVELVPSLVAVVPK